MDVLVEPLEAVYSQFLNNLRTVQVFLPGDYYHPSQKRRRYQVVYANDGQDMAAVGLVDTLSQLWSQGRLAPLIVVAISASDDRLNEYGTASIPNSDGLGARAQAYSDFIVRELIPSIDRRYSVQPGPQHTAIIGWSLGGLSAFDVAWRHADNFGVVGVFSGSFWWRREEATLAARQASRIMHQVVRLDVRKPALRMWFEAGTQDETCDRDGNGVIDSIQDTTELMDELALKGYHRGADMVYVEVPGGQHNQATWGHVLLDFLTWAFPHA
jgi:enterochelin esterase-like enzyme